MRSRWADLSNLASLYTYAIPGIGYQAIACSEKHQVVLPGIYTLGIAYKKCKQCSYSASYAQPAPGCFHICGLKLQV